MVQNKQQSARHDDVHNKGVRHHVYVRRTYDVNIAQEEHPNNSVKDYGTSERSISTAATYVACMCVSLFLLCER
jgi:hypothetical protein